MKTHQNDFNIGEQTPLTPVNRLKINIHTWRSVTENQYILDVVEHGYKIPFKTEPGPIHIKKTDPHRIMQILLCQKSFLY